MKAVLEKNDNKLHLRGEETTLRLIEGMSQVNYLIICMFIYISIVVTDVITR